MPLNPLPGWVGGGHPPAPAQISLGGAPWTFLWILGLPVIGAALHVIWCRRNGINPLTAEPRDRYERLRRRPPS